jgi:LuxR family maltose regulon positive regulatory protein
MTATVLDASPAADALRQVPGPLTGGAPRRPTPRGAVRRPLLTGTLGTAGAPPVAVLVAPAGYGKTALLREWSRRDARPFAWVTLDRRHDLPRCLLSSIARAVDEAVADARSTSIVLVLDDVHLLTSQGAREIIAALTRQPPEGMTIALASRTELGLPLARLRAEGLVTELRPADLAMTRAEAAALLRAGGLRLDRDELDALVRRTEGWPAALSLAALSLAEEPVPGRAVARFGGDDRLIAEYLRDEVLAGLSADQRRFVLHTSILDVLTAPLCDEILERSGSAATLTLLPRAGFPLVALDHTAERYRHHRLLADMLRAELRRTEPDVEAALHRRASGWHASAGDRERALRHALAADEIGRAGDLVWAGLPASIERGSSAAVEHWLTRFTDAQLASHPRLALAAAGTQLAYGQGDLAEHWLKAAAAVPGPEDAGEVRGGIAALQAALGRDGLGRMSEDAARAMELLAPDSPCQALCRLIAGIAGHLRGDHEIARQQLEDGARRAAVPAPQVHALCLSQLALVALDEHDTEEAAGLSTRARSQVARYGLDHYPTSALVLAVSALVRAQRGRIDDAQADLQTAASLLERLTDLARWYEIEVAIVLARAALRMSDVNVARTQLAAAARLAARAPEAVVLHDWLHAAEAGLAECTRSPARLLSSLTTSELQILGYLPTHLSFREIAERTYVSANTVKTQANAVYRKLDVCSRSEAVACARQLGLLDP